MQALASIAGAAATGGGGAAAGAAKKTTANLRTQMEFNEFQGIESAEETGAQVCTSATVPGAPALNAVGERIGENLQPMFPPDQLGRCTQGQMEALANGIKTGAQKSPLPWGDNVLPPGLYEFNWDNNSQRLNSQKLKPLGLIPAIYFCKEGPVNANDIQTGFENGAEQTDPFTPCVHENGFVEPPKKKTQSQPTPPGGSGPPAR